VEFAIIMLTWPLVRFCSIGYMTGVSTS
jgi:hypothetical protein